MESILSLEELHISFADQEFKFMDSIIEEQNQEEASDLLRQIFNHENSRRRGRTVERQSSSRHDCFLKSDYVVANTERKSCVGKLPDISPTTQHRRIRNGMKNDRIRGEFSCIDVDDFTISGSPAMMNTKRRIEERNQWIGSARRDHLPSTEIEDGYLDRQKKKNDPVVKYKGNLDSSRSHASNLSLRHNLTKDVQALPSEHNVLPPASPRNIFSPRPRSAFRSTDAQKGRKKDWTEKNTQNLPLDLPEKITEFIEMEISLIKGGEKMHSTQKRTDRSLSAYYSQETELFGPKSKESRKSGLSPLLQKRISSGEKTGCYSKRNMDSGKV